MTHLPANTCPFYCFCLEYQALSFRSIFTRDGCIIRRDWLPVSLVQWPDFLDPFAYSNHPTNDPWTEPRIIQEQAEMRRALEKGFSQVLQRVDPLPSNWAASVHILLANDNYKTVQSHWDNTIKMIHHESILLWPFQPFLFFAIYHFHAVIFSSTVGVTNLDVEKHRACMVLLSRMVVQSTRYPWNLQPQC